ANLSRFPTNASQNYDATCGEVALHKSLLSLRPLLLYFLCFFQNIVHHPVTQINASLASTLSNTLLNLPELYVIAMCTDLCSLLHLLREQAFFYDLYR